MDQIVRQLVSVRQRARRLLIMRRIAQWLTVVVLLAIGLGLIDFALRLPGWLRLIVGGLVLFAAVSWLVSRLIRASAFKPDLSLLALRLERQHPKLAGHLASAVEFATHPEVYRGPVITEALAGHSLKRVQAELSDVRVSDLINAEKPFKNGSLAVGATIVLAASVLLAPGESWLAMQRWLLPLSDAQWPRRVELMSMVQPQVWPDDTPMELQARVEKGYHEGMRTWVTYRAINPDGSTTGWEQLLMSEQSAASATDEAAAGGAGTFKRLLDVATLLPAGEAGAAGGQGDRVIEFYFEAGDDRTDRQQVRVVRRPTIEALYSTVTPPEYARTFSNSETRDLTRQSGAVASMSSLAGSVVQWRVELNKPLAISAAELPEVLPGFAELPDLTLRPLANAQGDPAFELTFTLSKDVQSAIYLEDADGMTNMAERVYRMNAIEDALPSVSMAIPVADEAVLPTAVIETRGLARDDVAVFEIAVEAQQEVNRPGGARNSEPARAEPDADVPAADQAGEPAAPAESAGNQPPVHRLVTVTGLQPELTAEYTLDLGPMNLRPGDVLALTAVAQDNYQLNGDTHQPVRSAPRRLRIIDEITLVSQLRGELSGLRQQAMRLADRQRDLQQTEPGKAQLGQQQMSRNLEAQSSMVKALQDRAQRNRLEDDGLNQLMGQVQQNLSEAGEASQQAAEQLEQAADQKQRNPEQARQSESQAREAQTKVADALSELTGLLDQGQDAVELQMQLRQVEAMQKALQQDTRELMPRTLGKENEELTADEKRAIEDLAARQKALADRTDKLVEQMRSTAEKMRQDPNAQQATAEAMSEAAEQAQQEGLKQEMEQAAENAQQNQLSQTSEHQEKALSTVQKMLNSTREQERKQQEILRRHLMQLADKLKRLVEQQNRQVERSADAQQLPQLADGQAQVRQNTMAAEDEARSDPKTTGAAGIIKRAVEHQGEAIVALRESKRPGTQASQKKAVGALEEALRMIEEQAAQAQQEQQEQEREKLRQEYLALAKQQDQLRERTQPLADRNDLERKERGELIRLGHEQSELRDRVSGLAEKPDIAGGLVFKHLHEQADKLAQGVVRDLRSGAADGSDLRDQTRVAAALRQMAAALEEAPDDDEFNRTPGQEQGGGGGQGGQQPPQPLIPPVAELKLLREMQADVFDLTRTIDQSADLNEARRRELMELSARQQTLMELGQELVDKMQQQQGSPGGIQQVPVPEGEAGEDAPPAEGEQAPPGARTMEEKMLRNTKPEATR